MKQIVPNLKLNQMRRTFLLFLSVFAFSAAMFAQNPDNGGDITGDQTICAGDTPGVLTSTAPASGGGTGDIEYLWMFTTNAAAQQGGSAYNAVPGNSDSESYQPGVLNATTYFVRCARRVGSNNPAFSAEAATTIKVTVNDLPTAMITNSFPSQAFSGTTVDFTAFNAGPGATYAWDFDGDGNTDLTSMNPNDPNASFTYNSGGNFNITLTVTSAGCSTTFPGSFNVLNPFDANISDPCNCEDQLNYIPPGSLSYFNHDYILIGSNTGDTWTITSISNFSGATSGVDLYIVDAQAGTVTPVEVGDVIPVSSTGYFLDVWFDGSMGGWEVTVENQNDLELTTGAGAINPCPLCPDAPLPVELIDFKASVKNDKQVELTWITATEIDNSHFEIERSLDGARFDFVGQREGAGSTTVNTYYNFMDDAAIAGETYYRLKQVDLDGEYTYSDVVSVRIDSDQVIVSVTPNPVVDKTTVRLGAEIAPNTILELVSTTGQIVRTYNVGDNATSLEMDMTGLAEGIYLLSVANASREQKAFYKVVKF